MLRSAHIDFKTVISNKPMSKDKTFVVYCSQNKQGKCRLGVSIPKAKIKNATERNKLKRIARHSLFSLNEKAIDIVIVYRGTANKYDAKLISNSLEFHKNNIIKITEEKWKT